MLEHITLDGERRSVRGGDNASGLAAILKRLPTGRHNINVEQKKA
jgi:hypothetical protein